MKFSNKSDKYLIDFESLVRTLDIKNCELFESLPVLAIESIPGPV